MAFKISGNFGVLLKIKALKAGCKVSGKRVINIVYVNIKNPNNILFGERKKSEFSFGWRKTVAMMMG